MLNTIHEFKESLSNYEKILGAIVGISVSLVAISKGVKFFWKAILDANAFARELAEVIPEIKKMSKEFKPNGGKSLIDVLNKLENRIIHTNEKIKIVISCMGMAAFETDEEGRYISVSKQWSSTTNLLPEQAYGNGWLNMIPEEDREEVFKEWVSCIEQNREFHLTTKISDSEKTVSIVAWPIRNIDGTVEKFFGILI